MPDSFQQPAPSPPDHDDTRVVRLLADVRLEQAIALVADAIRQAVTLQQPGLLVDVRAAGFAPPSLGERHRFVRLWAEAAAGRLCLALVARPDFIDAERFGVVAAANFGLLGQVFEGETEARAWLRSHATAIARPKA